MRDRSTHERSTFCHVRLMPPQNTTHSCVHASRSSQLVSCSCVTIFSTCFLFVRHDLLNFFPIFCNSGKLDSCSTTLINHCVRFVVINHRHCVRQDNFIMFIEFFKISNFPMTFLATFCTFSHQLLTMFFTFSRQSLTMFFKISLHSLTMFLCAALGLTPTAPGVQRVDKAMFCSESRTITAVGYKLPTTKPPGRTALPK